MITPQVQNLATAERNNATATIVASPCTMTPGQLKVEDVIIYCVKAGICQWKEETEALPIKFDMKA